MDSTDTRHENKTLVPVLCMHRSGSSLTTNVLADLGMTLGPFELLAAGEHNPHGHFESRPFCDLHRQVQCRALGFSDDMPESLETFRRLVESEGCWPGGVEVPPQWFDRGEELLHRLVACGAVSGFKDPRLPLVWPFWVQVFRRIPGVRVVPVVLLRSPHEIASSLFVRSKGRFDYHDALEVTAVHFKRMRAILADWRGPLARIRYLPQYFVDDLRTACRLLGLTWREDVYSRIVDSKCTHHEAAAVVHPAQALFEQLAGLPAQDRGCENAARIETGALLRERLLRRTLMDTEAELASAQAALADVRAELSATEAEAKRLVADLSAAAAEAKRLTADLSAAEAEAKRLAFDLRLTRASRVWRLRELLVAIPGLKPFANRP